MSANYKNWVPNGMITALSAGTVVLGAGTAALMCAKIDPKLYIDLPDGGVGLDVGCGSGALTIACAKRNPQGRMIGIDRWGKEYASFSRQLCEDNSAAENVHNTEFRQGDACKLDFPDEYFDAVTSNYVYHNVTGVNKQDLIRETLRVLKKGGTFAIHDIMSEQRYGDMLSSENCLLRDMKEQRSLTQQTECSCQRARPQFSD